MIMKRTNYLLYTNDYFAINIDDYKEAWEEWLEANELDAKEHDLDSFIYHSFELDWDDLKANMEYCVCDGECVITGSCGTWQGRREIEYTREDSIMESIARCCGGSIETLTVRKVNGHLEVSACHHDGTNHFDIYLLNERGINAGDDADLSNRTYHKAMPEYLF